tara:strand:- start:695 stop:1105 length:411 start_codon:yes stop_codon:yes gene_type:complete
MKLNTRRLVEKDYDILKEWWDFWPGWEAPPRDLLPNNGTGGVMVESNGTPIVAGFLYTTNSKMVLLEWVISNPNYRESDRKDAIYILITECERIIKELGYKYGVTITKNQHLINKHKYLGWKQDEKPSYELVKVLK